MKLIASSFLLSFCITYIQAAKFVIQFKNDEYSFNSFFSKYFNTTSTISNADDLQIAAQSLNLAVFELGNNFKGITGDFGVDTIKKLYYDNKISSISLDRDLVLAEVQELAPKHLARISQIETLNKSQKLDYVYDPSAGIGVDVYILDSGILSTHPEFNKRVTKIADFTGEKAHSSQPSIGHGTYVAGVVGSETFGVAKKVNLFDVKVTDKSSRTKLSSVISALNLILTDSKITNRPTVVVIPSIMKKNAILNGAVEAVVKEGIPVVVPAGNDGKNACEYSPASAKGALTVGAIDLETDSIANFSNWGACVDVFAPGVKIQTTDFKDNNKVVLKSGTSLSTGITAGLVAYFLGMGEKGENVTSKIIESCSMDIIPSNSLSSKPLTSNKIIFNLEGEPSTW